MNRSAYCCALALVALVTACGAESATTNASDGSKVVKDALDRDVRHIANEIQVVQIQVGLAIKDSSDENVNALAQGAQQAHDDLSSAKSQVAVDAPAGASVSGELYGAVDELKNAMGALVAYTGTPNPATLARFSSQWQTGVSDWNTAVDDLYRGTSQKPPVIETG